VQTNLGAASVIGRNADQGPDAPPPVPTPEPELSLVRPALYGLVATTAVVIGALYGGSSFETHLPGAWFFGSQGSHLGSLATDSRNPSTISLVLVYGGIILLCRVWWGVMRQLRRHRGFPVKKVVAMAAIWVLPLLIAPPLFSRDVYSYAGQGELVSHNISPYKYGPGVLGSTPFSSLPDEVWNNTASPYGPVFLGIDGGLDDLSGHTILADIVLLRLLELAGVALMAAATPTLARGLGRDPAEAVLLGAGSPLVMLTLIGGAHNDALMVGLLMAGLAIWKRAGPIPGIAVCAVAAGVKFPALLGVVFIGWAWAGPGASFWRRVRQTSIALTIAAAVLEVAGLITGLGWGWVKTSDAAGSSFTGITPVSSLSHLVSAIAGVVDLHLSVHTLHGVFSVVGLAVAGIIGIRLLLHSPEHGLVRGLGLTLLFLALLGPVVWGWYVTWGVVVLAPYATGRLRTVLIVLVSYWSIVGATRVSAFFTLVDHGNQLLNLMLALLLAAIAIVPLGMFHHRKRRTPALPIDSGGPHRLPSQSPAPAAG
jgi:hypothetical protein